MIVSVRGTLIEKDPARVVVEAGGIGYELLIPLSTYDRLPHTDEEVRLLAVHCVREDDEILFGFATEAERGMFVKLVSVSGVGPRTALSLISGLSVGELALAIAAGNAKRISAIKGVGRKTAEKICVELKDKVNALEAQALASSGGAAGASLSFARDAILALASLGFAEDAANKMVSEVLAKCPEAHDAETVIRLALSGGKTEKGGK